MFLNRELIKVLTITTNQMFLLKMALLTSLVDLVKTLPLKNNTHNRAVETILVAAAETILPRVELIKLILMPQELITTKLLILQPITTNPLILQLTMTITTMEKLQILIKLELELETLEHQLILLKS